MVLQNYQNLIEMTSNIFHIVAFGVGFKCPRKIHLNTQWGGGVKNASQYLTDTLMLNQSGEGDRFSTSITVCTLQYFKPSAGTERGEVQLQQD